MRDGPAAVPGVITTSTSSKIDRTRCASSRFRFADRGHPAIGDQPADAGERARAPLQTLFVRERLRIVVDAAEIAREQVAVHRAGRIVGVAHHDVVAEFAQQRPRLVDRRRAGPCRPGPSRVEAPWCSTRFAAARDLAPPPRRNPPSAGVVAVASRNRAASSTVLAIGPLTDRPFHAPSCGASGTRSRCGLMPNRPHHVDGIRIDPMPSEPSAIDARPAATAAPLPPLLPPGVRSVFHGLRVAPNATVSVNGQIIISGTAVLPRMTAPAARSRRTTSASSAFGRPVRGAAVRRHLALRRRHRP